jgi:hypothetical protein
MHYTLTTPPPSRAADRPTLIDDALVAEARRLLKETVATIPPGAALHRRDMEALFATPMAAFCATTSPRAVPIEKLIVAIKLAWASMPEPRLRLGEAGPDALAGAVSASIQAYFRSVERKQAD